MVWVSLRRKPWRPGCRDEAYLSLASFIWKFIFNAIEWYGRSICIQAVYENIIVKYPHIRAAHAIIVICKMPRSAVGNVSGYRCVSDCRFRGHELDPGPVPYFRGDWSWNDFYGYFSSLPLILSRRVVVSYKRKYEGWSESSRKKSRHFYTVWSIELELKHMILQHRCSWLVTTCLSLVIYVRYGCRQGNAI